MPTAAEFAAKITVGDADLDRLNSAINDAPGTWTTDQGEVVDNLRKRLVDAGTGLETVFDSVSDMLADEEMGYSGTNVTVVAGVTPVRAKDFWYLVVASDASDYHVETAGNVRLKVTPINGGEYHAEAWSDSLTASIINGAFQNVLAEVKPATTNFQHTPTHTFLCSSSITATEQLTFYDTSPSDTESTSEAMGLNLDLSKMRVTTDVNFTPITSSIVYIQARNCYVWTPGVDCAEVSSGIRYSNCKTSTIFADNIVERAADDDSVFDLTSVTAGQYARVTSVVTSDWSSIGGPASAKIGDIFRVTTTNADISALGDVCLPLAIGTDQHRFLEGNDNCVVRGMQFYEQTRADDIELRRSVGLYVDSYDLTITDIRGGWTHVPIRFGSNAAEVTLQNVHPFNGVGLGALSQTAVTTQGYYYVETVASVDWSSVGGSATTSVGDVFQATATNADISALGQVRELPYNPLMVLTHPDSADIYIRGSYLDNGVVCDLSGGGLTISDSHVLELAGSVVVDQPRMRVLANVDKDGGKPDTVLSGAQGMSVGFFSSSGVASPDAGSPSYDFGPNLSAHNSTAAWDAQEDERIWNRTATRVSESYMRDNDEVDDEIPNHQMFVNGRFIQEYRSEGETDRVVYAPEDGEMRAEFKRFVAHEILNLASAATGTIVSNTFEVTDTHTEITMSGSSTELHSVTGGQEGDLLVLRPASGKTVVIKHDETGGNDEFYTGGSSLILDTTTKTAVFYYDGFNWLLVGGTAAQVQTTFSSRAALVSAVSSGMVWANGTVIDMGVVSVVAESGSTAISGLPGLKPFGQITPFHWADNTNPGPTDLTSALQSAVEYASSINSAANSVGQSTPVDLLGQIVGISDQGDYGINFGSLTGVRVQNGTIKAIGTWTGTTPLFSISDTGGTSATHIDGHNLLFEGEGKAAGVLFSNVSQMTWTGCTVHGQIGYGFRSETKATELRMSACKVFQFYFGETGYDDQANRTAYGFDMNTADFVLLDCVANYCARPFHKGTAGLNWQAIGCHFYNGGLSTITDADSVYSMYIDGPEGGVVSNLYSDRGVLYINGDQLAQANGYALQISDVNHATGGGSDPTDHKIIIETTVANNELSGLTLSNHRFPNEVGNIEFVETGSGTFTDPLEWTVTGFSQRDGTPVTGSPDLFSFGGYFSADGAGEFIMGRGHDVTLKFPRKVTISADHDNDSSAAESYIDFATDGTTWTRMDETGQWLFGLGQASGGGAVGSIQYNGNDFRFVPTNSGGTGLDFSKELFFDHSDARWEVETAFAASGYIKTESTTVASLTAAATAGAGARSFVTDSSVVHSGNSGAIVTGGGSNAVPVYSDGTNWRIG